MPCWLALTVARSMVAGGQLGCSWLCSLRVQCEAGGGRGLTPVRVSVKPSAVMTVRGRAWREGCLLFGVGTRTSFTRLSVDQLVFEASGYGPRRVPWPTMVIAGGGFPLSKLRHGYPIGETFGTPGAQNWGITSLPETEP